MIALTTAPIKNGIFNKIPSPYSTNAWCVEKSDPPANEKLQVEADVPEYLSNVGYHLTLTTLQASFEDHAIMALDFLIPVGEYSVKGYIEMNTNKPCNFNWRMWHSLNMKPTPIVHSHHQ